ncbi:MAG: universal stress protein [Chitinophagaceae bacterium]|nr:universal stress protein [Oligoflexus sp.]
MAVIKVPLKMLVPIALNDGLEGQVNYAETLASALGCDVRYLHVLSPGGGSQSESSEIDRRFAMLENDNVHIIREKLMEVLEKQDRSNKSISELIFMAGKSVPATILDEARMHDADIILCGAAKASVGILPEALSTVLSVMGKAPIPVIVAPPQKPSEFNKTKFRIVVADDLGPDSVAAVRWALSLASHIMACRVFHVHVEPLTREVAIETFYATSCGSDIPIVPEFDPGVLYDQKMEATKKNLESRLTQLGIGGTIDKANYETQLFSGSVAEVIAHESELDFADLIVFGRHHFIHNHPLALGKVSYKTMLRQHYPVVVVPSTFLKSADSSQRVPTGMINEDEYVESSLTIHYP